MDNLAVTGGTGLLAALLIQGLKNADWAPWFSRETPYANLGLSVLVAFATSLGIHWTWDAASDTFAIVGLGAWLRHGTWQWFAQWISQHASYKALVVPGETLGEIRAILKDQNSLLIIQESSRHGTRQKT